MAEYCHTHKLCERKERYVEKQLYWNNKIKHGSAQLKRYTRLDSILKPALVSFFQEYIEWTDSKGKEDVGGKYV